MLKIGITGAGGFIGKNLSIAVEKYPSQFKLVEFDKSYFNNFNLLCHFVLQCDVIVHLAALSRHPNTGFVYDNNVFITTQLINAMSTQKVKPYVIFTSSVHDKSDTEYGRSKRFEYNMLSSWAQKSHSNFSCLVLSNVFGPFCKPNYASFIATFCYKLSRNETPNIEVDRVMNLTYVDNLASYILNKIRSVTSNNNITNEYINVAWDVEVKVSEVLKLLMHFKENYTNYKSDYLFSNEFEKNLFLTFKSYYDES